jgi:hypothetical protein
MKGYKKMRTLNILCIDSDENNSGALLFKKIVLMHETYNVRIKVTFYPKEMNNQKPNKLKKFVNKFDVVALNSYRFADEYKELINMCFKKMWLLNISHLLEMSFLEKKKMVMALEAMAPFDTR